MQQDGNRSFHKATCARSRNPNRSLNMTWIEFWFGGFKAGASVSRGSLSCMSPSVLTLPCSPQLLFQKSKGSVQLAVELLDTEEENSDEPMEFEVRCCTVWVSFVVICLKLTNIVLLLVSRSVGRITSIATWTRTRCPRSWGSSSPRSLCFCPGEAQPCSISWALSLAWLVS